MTTGIPEKIPLVMPPGDPEAVEELVRSVAGAAFCLAVLGGDLAGPAVAAPGWLGDDATAAAEQIGRVAGLVHDASGAVLPATARLSAHARCLREVRSQVTALRAEQDEEHRAAWSRLSAVVDVGEPGQAALPAAAAIGEELSASEASRARRHEALLAEVADDAAATAQVLAESSAIVGGTGRPGDEGRTLAHLAVLLPGWGEEELAARGTELADALLTEYFETGEMDALVEGAAAYAGDAAFASALLAGLGTEGVGQLLATLGGNQRGPLPDVARLLASAFGAAVPSGRDRRRVENVLSATYVRPDDRLWDSDVAAAGVAAVLASGGFPGGGGPGPVVAAGWARQLLLREHATGMNAGTGTAPPDGDPALADPVAVAIGVLADDRDAVTSAALLAEPDIWQALLSRFWGDGGMALGRVVGAAASVDGPAGAEAVRTGVEVIGAGLLEGDPDGWAVSRRTVAAVSPALGGAVADQVGVAVEALSVGMDGRLGERQAALRGLSLVSLDRYAAEAIGRSLFEWSGAAPPALAGAGSLAPSPAVAIPAAFVAVQEYGQRLTHALDAFEERQHAENVQTLWDGSVGAAVAVGSEFARGPAGTVLPLLEDYLAILIGADGTWDNGTDHGARFTADDAAEAVLARWEPRGALDAEALARQAREAFERTATAMGEPRPPTSPDSDFRTPLEDLAVDELTGRTADKIADGVPAGRSHP